MEYETSDTNFSLEKYDEKAVSEVKIRAWKDDLYGDWSELKKFKIKDIINSLFGDISYSKGLFGNNN